MAQTVLTAEQVRKVFFVYNNPAEGTTELSSTKRWSLFGTRKSFELVALEDASLEVHQNEFVALLGPSGCGKSTLLRIWAGLETVTGGRVTFNGQPIAGPDPQRAMVFQSERAVFPWLTVAKNIELGPKLQGVPKAERDQRVRDTIKLIQLDGFNRAYPATLSGGMLQRVAVGRAMINRPQVLLMDEPFGALDAQTRATLQDHLIRIWRETQQTIVFVTHDIEEATYLATRIAILTPRPGRIKGVVPVPIPHPRSRTDAAFVETRKKVAALLEGAPHPA
jgi:ABC-type nitrate/sulfonate/bicarbonate transport system ATPase subunit